MSSSAEANNPASSRTIEVVGSNRRMSGPVSRRSNYDKGPGERRASIQDPKSNRPWIQSLSPELLRTILDHLDADPDKLVNLDHRAYLSQESFKAPGRPQPSQAQDIASFRLACKMFSELGAMHQFTRITTRFSQKGFQRLENIARQPHLAKNVRKFSYMVPFFYEKGSSLRYLLFTSHF